jgi:hypothetical protein
MPLPADDTLAGGDNTASSSTSAPVGNLSIGEVLEKFKSLGQEAQAEEAEGSDEEEGDGEVEVAGGVEGDAKKKKKKKKKGKSKAGATIAKLQ